MKDLSKSGYQTSKIKSIDLEQIFWKLIEMQSGIPNFSRIQFEVIVNVIVPFISDVRRIEIIMEHLIKNSITFSDVKKVRPSIRICAEIDAKEATIQIVDNGVGIRKDLVHSLSHMFYRLSGQTSGFGLGLCIVKENIRQLQASIQIESEIGFGSIFRLSVPNRLVRE